MSYILSIAAVLRRYTKPIRDSHYLAFIRRLPCVACKSTRQVEAAHIGPHAYSERASDWTALPLCRKCHQDGPEALHKVGPERFQLAHGIEFASLQAICNHFYFLRFGKYAEGWMNEDERRKAA